MAVTSLHEDKATGLVLESQPATWRGSTGSGTYGDEFVVRDIDEEIELLRTEHRDLAVAFMATAMVWRNRDARDDDDGTGS